MGVAVEAVLIGMLVMIAGTIPRNLIFAANLRYFQSVPWAVPVTAVYLACFWRYLQGAGPPPSTAGHRRNSLRANRVPGRVSSRASTVARGTCVRSGSCCGGRTTRRFAMRSPSTSATMPSPPARSAHAQAEWQAVPGAASLVWTTGPDASFWMSIVALLAVAAADVWVYFKLAGAARRPR